MAVVASIGPSKSLASQRLRPIRQRRCRMAKLRSMTQPRLRLHSRRDRDRSVPAATRQEMEAVGIARSLDDLEPQALARRDGSGEQVL